MAASDHLGSQFPGDPRNFHPDEANHPGHGGTVYYPQGVHGDAEPRCTACGHRVIDPRNGHVPVETRKLGPAAAVKELPARAKAKRQHGR